MAFLLTVLWIGRIVEGLTGPLTLHGETTMTIQALDLGLVVPIAVGTAILGLRRHAAAMAAATAFAVMFVAMCAAIGSMLVSAWLVTGVLELPPILVFAVAAGAGLVVGVRMYASVRTDTLAPAAATTPSSARPVDLPVG